MPYDKIVVIVDNSNYGGSGGALSVAYNGSSGPDVFVHEFGHSFARLHDEYNLYGDGSLSGTVQRNCYAGTPPTTQWDSVVSLSSYTKGCRYANWYRSSASSLMLSLSTKYFNPISVKLTNLEIDYFAGKRK